MLELAGPKDRQAVERLAQQVHSLHINWRPDLFCSTPELYCADRFEEAVRDRELYVARLDGMTVGYVLLKFRQYDHSGQVPRKIMLLDEICVEQRLRGQGIGKRIMADVFALARAFGCRDVMLGVYPQNDEAISFYRKCGFQIRSIDMLRSV